MPGYFTDETGSSFYPESVISETIMSTTIVSEHPVEGAQNVHDHAQPQAETMTVVMLISETPLVPPVAVPEATTSDGETLERAAFSGPAVIDTADRPNERRLPAIRQQLGRPAQLYRPFVDVSDVPGNSFVEEDGVLVLDAGTLTFNVRAVAPRDIPVEALNWLRERRGKILSYYSTKFPEFGTCVITSISTVRTNRAALEITVELKQVRIAQAQVVTLPPRKRKKRAADPKVDKGAKPKKSVQTTLEPASWLAGVSNFLAL